MIFAGLRGDYNVLHTDAEHMKASSSASGSRTGCSGWPSSRASSRGWIPYGRRSAAQRGEVEVQGADQDRRHHPRPGPALGQEGRRAARARAWSRSSAAWSTSAARWSRRARRITWSPAGPGLRRGGVRGAPAERRLYFEDVADGRALLETPAMTLTATHGRPLRLARNWEPAAEPGHHPGAAAPLPVLRPRLAGAPAAPRGARVHGLRVAGFLKPTRVGDTIRSVSKTVCEALDEGGRRRHRGAAGHPEPARRGRPERAAHPARGQAARGVKSAPAMPPPAPDSDPIGGPP